MPSAGYSAMLMWYWQWEPICSNGGTAGTGPRTGEIPGSCFRPDEINQLSETTKAAYVMLKFGGNDALLGSTAVELVRAAALPVLVVAHAAGPPTRRS